MIIHQLHFTIYLCIVYPLQVQYIIMHDNIFSSEIVHSFSLSLCLALYQSSLGLTLCSRYLKHCWFRTSTNSDSKSWSLYHAPPVTERSGSKLYNMYTFFLEACQSNQLTCQQGFCFKLPKKKPQKTRYCKNVCINGPYITSQIPTRGKLKQKADNLVYMYQ